MTLNKISPVLLLLLSINFLFTACQNSISETVEDSTEMGMKPRLDDSEEVFIVVEEPPQMIGGMQSLASKIVYPEKAKEQMIEGKVFVQFIVNEEGRVVEPKVIKSPSHILNSAALEAVQDLEFTAPKQRGQKVKVKYTLPIVFQLKS